MYFRVIVERKNGGRSVEEKLVCLVVDIEAEFQLLGKGSWGNENDPPIENKNRWHFTIVNNFRRSYFQNYFNARPISVLEIFILCY